MLVHAFFQLVLGVVAVAVAAWLSARRAGVPMWPRLLGGIATAILTALLASGVYQGVVVRAAAFARRVLYAGAEATQLGGDGQGALVLLPVFQLALFLGLLAASGRARSPRLFLGVVILFSAQAVLLAALSELGEQHGLLAGAVGLRGLALAVPLGLWLALSGRSGFASTARRTA
jgi:hypothetical protein